MNRSEFASRFPLWKRALDLAIVLALSPIWLPVMGLLAILIKLVSPGPIFYRQERIGYRGRHFTCFKFRSMKPNSATRVHEDYLRFLIRSDCPMTKLDATGDSRLIPMGRLLRSSGLDELPQLLNVLRGEMSLVGPRPCTAYEFESASEFLSPRLSAPPGITGYWQVNGKNQTTFRQMIAMDEHYARHMSALLDAKILLKTFPTLLTQIFAARSPREKAAPERSAAGRHPGGSEQGF